MSYLPETTVIPAMPYVPEFNRDELKSVKLKHVGGLVSREKKVPLFDARSGVEALLYCEEATREAFKYLRVTDGPDMYNLFNETLTGSAVRKWNNVVSGITTANRSPAEFDRSILTYYAHFVDDKARDTMYEYLLTRDCGKPFKSSNYDHVDRMEELYRYAARLPGTVPSLDINVAAEARQIKQKIYNTFPERWRFAFEDVHEVSTTSQMEINKFMNRQRVKDDKFNKKKEKKKQSSGKGDKNGNGKAKQDHEKKRKGGQGGRSDNNKRPKGQIKPEDKCPIHGGHTWLQCFDNKHGPNFRPPRQSRTGSGRGSDNRTERKDFHYSNDHYHNEHDRDRRYRSQSPARRAPSSPLTWDESHHFDNRSGYEGSARSAGSRYGSKSRSRR